jgi:hypothetical protein
MRMHRGHPRLTAGHHRNRSAEGIPRCLRLVLPLLAASLLACGDGGSGDNTSFETAGTFGDTSSGPPPGPCSPKGCDVAADCCPETHQGLAPGCHGDYPNNWSCVQGECVHGGCDVNGSDCDIVPGMICAKKNGTGQCVVACTNDTQCETVGHMKGATCSGLSDGPIAISYCIQPLP